MRSSWQGLQRVLGVALLVIALPVSFDGASRCTILPLAHSANVRERSAEQLYTQGDQLLDASRFDAARQALQQALQLYQQYPDLPGQTKTFKTLGHTYYYQERYAESLPYYQQSLDVARQIPDLDAQGRALFYLGSAHRGMKQFDRARVFYEQSLHVIRQVTRPDTKTRDLECSVLTNLGLVYTTLGQAAKGAALSQEAVAIARAIDAPAAAREALRNLGFAYLKAGDAAQSIAAYQQALVLARQLGQQEIFNTLNALGNAYATFGRLPQALEVYQQALELARALTNRTMEGETLQKITAIYLQQGQYGPVLEFAQQALVLARQLPGEGPGTALQQEALQSLGQAYQSLGQYQKAVDHYEESLILARALGDQLAQKLLLKYLSVCYAFLGLPAQASKARQDSARLPDFEALVPHKLTGGSPQDTATPPNTLPNITPAGQVPSSPLAATPESPRRDLAVITDPSSPQVANPAGTEDTQAITRSILVGTSEDTQAITRSLKMLVPQNENYLIKAVDLLSEGAAYARQQQWERAENAYREALAMAQTHGNLQLQSLGWFYLGLLYKTQGQSAQALEAYQQRVNIAKMLQTPAEVASTLYLMGDLQARLGILEQANATLRQSLSFFETLRVGLRDSNNVSLFDTQRGAYQRLQEVLVALHQPEAALEVAERGRARAYAELLSVRSQGVPTLDALTLSQIQQTARTQQATLVVYSLVGSQQPSHEQLLIWVIQSSGAVTLRSVHLEAGGLKKRVKQLRDLLTQAEITRLINAKETTKDLTIFSESLAALYQVLIQPIADLLPRHPLDRLIFLPQGDLFLVPFAALADQTGQPLLERHTILSAPSIQVVNLIKKPLQRNQSGRTASSGLLQPALIVGNPVQDLPAAAAEAQAIARLLHTPALIGKQATRAVILQQMPSKRLIHLATHGSFEPLRGTGLPGFITLAPSGHDDGFLTSNDIMDLRLKAELVVLSACDTGRGTITGDGVIGLSRAFFAAGASSLVASLWSVPDDSTGLLMDQFYQALGQHPDKARALRQAMLFTRSRYPLPSHWAAFTLMGDAL